MHGLVIGGVRLVGLAATVPKNREDNTQLASLGEKQRTEIVDQVGIRYRHVANGSFVPILPNRPCVNWAGMPTK